MYHNFAGTVNDIATRTDLRILLDDPHNPTGHFDRELQLSVTGTMRVEIGEMFTVHLKAAAFDERWAAGEVAVLPWRVAAMDAQGDSPFGPVRVTTFEGRQSVGTVRQLIPGQPFPALLEAEVCAQVSVPELGDLHTATAVSIRAEINQIPPFGTEAKHANSAILADSGGMPRGLLVGRSITLIGPA